MKRAPADAGAALKEKEAPADADAVPTEKDTPRGAAALADGDAVAPGVVSAAPGGWQNVDLPPADDAQAWFQGRLPDDWFTEVTVTVDREEVTVVGRLADETSEETGAAEGRISRFRAESRSTRIEIAQEAEARYGRKVSWGAQLGEVTELFTHISVPVMTRLRQPERQVLDTLVDAGVARSRSEALAWAVKLTGEHADSWLASLREAMSSVDKLRSEGPEF